jgi:hypothetical protein
VLDEPFLLEEAVAVIGAAEEVDEVERVERRAVGVESEGNVDVDPLDVVVAVGHIHEIDQVSLDDLYSLYFGHGLVVLLPDLFQGQPQVVLGLVQRVPGFYFAEYQMGYSV